MMRARLLLPALALVASVPLAFAQTSTYQVPANAPYAVDLTHARPMPLPQANVGHQPLSARDAILEAVPPTENAVAYPGSAGDGAESPSQMTAPGVHAGVQPQNYGTSDQPYTTAQANADGDYTVKHYPFRAAGNVSFYIGTSEYLCSGSLIKPGIVVLAAHCVADYGSGKFYTGWEFAPAYDAGKAPYGTWSAKSATLLTAYINGTDGCAQYGVICPDDVAVLTLNTNKKGGYPGPHTGWLGYGYGSFGYNPSAQVLVTQLGYPCNLDSCSLMERTDSQGFTDASLSNNTIIGTEMTGGSSGGPWVENLGMQPSGGSGAQNVVVGVTSWGYVNTAVQQAGAAPFTSGNIQTIITAVCGATPGAC